MREHLHPDIVLWFERAGVEPPPAGVALAWNPQTLKQISTHALALGKASGQLPAFMKLLAEIEKQLVEIRNQIGIPRSAPPVLLPRVTTLFSTDRGWVSPGRWIPDILDRAAAFDPLHAGAREDLLVLPEELASFRLDKIVLLDNTDLDLDNCVVQRSADPSHWFGTGPNVFDAVREAAVLIHHI